MTRGAGRVASAAWGLVAVLCAGAALWTVAGGLVGVGLLGTEDRLRISACRQEGGGRSGRHVVCEGRLASGGRAGVRHDGVPGETVPVARSPWGTYTVVDTGAVRWATMVLVPVVPLAAAGLCGYASVRSFRGSGAAVERT
ncbi:hypothetical protein [Streptomyces sp. NPDC002640]